MKWVGFVCFLLSGFQSNGQTFGSSKNLGLGGSATSLSHVGQLIGNPAGIQGLDRWSVLISHHQDRFHEDVSTQHLMAAIPISSATLGIRFSRFGFRDLYNEMTTGVVYGRKFGPRLAVAFGFQQHTVKIPDYFGTRDYTFDTGIQYILTEKFRLGLWVEHLGHFSRDEPTGVRPIRGHFGGAVLLNDLLMMVTDVHYDNVVGLRNSWGMEYGIVPDLVYLRTGLSNKPFQQYGGIGFVKGKWGADLAFVFHRRLGMSSQIDFHYAF